MAHKKQILEDDDFDLLADFDIDALDNKYLHSKEVKHWSHSFLYYKIASKKKESVFFFGSCSKFNTIKFTTHKNFKFNEIKKKKTIRLLWPQPHTS